jgi:carbamoyltransferase
MAAVLGVSAHYHDAAAALVVDGQVVAAIQEERLSRVKNDASLPVRAMRACLAHAKLAPAALDAVVFYENPYAKLERILLSSLRGFPRSGRFFTRAMLSQLSNKLWVLDALAHQLGVARERVVFREHHASHAASAFFVSPFERAAVLCVDGVGELASTTLWRGQGERLELLESQSFPHSLGLLYAALTAYLGFEVNDGEAKVMGLSAYGQPRFQAEFAKLLHLNAAGSVSLDLEYFDPYCATELGFTSKLEALLGPRRLPGKPWDIANDARDQHYADVASTLQHALELALLGLAERARAAAGCDALCLAGGVALNALANAKLARSGPLFVQPAAGDAGGALGAALLEALSRGDARPKAPFSAALGPVADGDDAYALAKQLGLHAQRCSEPASELARRLARGELVAVAQGRCEWGPRALGQRSLLAAPAPATVRERINRAVKRREDFQPFAPAVLASAVQTWFGPHAELLAPYMTTVAEVLPSAREQLAATVHVDGSARLQTVPTDTFFGQVLTELGRTTGLPAVLNTSLNGRAEPIACSATDALHFYISQRVDSLLVDDVLITKQKPC